MALGTGVQARRWTASGRFVSLRFKAGLTMLGRRPRSLASRKAACNTARAAARVSPAGSRDPLHAEEPEGARPRRQDDALQGPVPA
eukprot:563284-Pleurochrysis_carterae.AAC.1